MNVLGANSPTITNPTREEMKAIEVRSRLNYRVRSMVDIICMSEDTELMLRAAEVLKPLTIETLSK